MRYAVRQTVEYKAIAKKLGDESRYIKNRKISLRYKMKEIEKSHPEYICFVDIMLKNLNHNVGFIKKQILKAFNVDKKSLNDLGRYFYILKEYATSRFTFEAKRKKYLKKAKDLSLQQLKGQKKHDNFAVAKSIFEFEKVFNTLLTICEEHNRKFKAFVGSLKNVFKTFVSEGDLIYQFKSVLARNESLNIPDFL